MSAITKSARRLSIETLENKELLAGNVTAAVSGNSLDIFGDALDNEIRVEEVSSSNFLVTGVNNTTVNGSPQLLFSLPFPDPELHVDLKHGNDVLRIKNISALAKITADTGDGLDKIQLDSVQLKPANSLIDIRTGNQGDVLSSKNSSAEIFFAQMGNGNDKTFLKETYADTLEVQSLAGDDRISIGFFNPRDLIVRSGAGDDMVRLYAIQGGHSDVLTGDGDDKVNAHGFVGGNLSVKTEDGNDRVDIRSGLYQSVVIQTGDHNDTVAVKPGSFPWAWGNATIGDLVIQTQANSDRVILDSVDVHRSQINTGSHDDKVKISGSIFHVGLDLLLADGNNWLKTTCTRYGNLTAWGGNGKDRVFMDKIHVDNYLEIGLADGKDYFSVNHSFSGLPPVFDGGNHFDRFVVSGNTNSWTAPAQSYSSNYEFFI
ncbi:MAG: hypothetical protein VX438_00955 [Planctomycetota bacterium]|nr:hypothetical protein [Planctomycetota bacterium]